MVASSCKRIGNSPQKRKKLWYKPIDVGQASAYNDNSKAMNQMERLPAGIGRGIYSYGEAALLLGVHPQKLGRWADGYTFPRKYDLGVSKPVLQTPRDAKGVISFNELIELFFVREYTSYGVKLGVVRETAKSLMPEFGPFPFASAKLKSDGKQLFQAVGQNLIQADVRQIVADFSVEFFAQIDFDEEVAKLYRPESGGRFVILDGSRAFGQPILETSGVPTFALYSLFLKEQDFGTVADWHEVPEDQVRAAVKFEVACRKAA